MDSRIHFSQSQKKAIAAPWRRTVSLVLSTAGSGKTLALTRRAVRIAVELVNGNEINSRILCICFNKGAADEMSQRIYGIVQSLGYGARINITRKQHEPKEMVTIEIRTFHSFGFWILRSAIHCERQQVGLRRGKINLLHGKDHRDIILETLVEAGQFRPSTKKSTMDKISRETEREFRRYKRYILEGECEKFLSPQDIKPQPLRPYNFEYKHAFELYVQRMSEQNSIDYDDMIAKSVTLVKTVPRLQEMMSARYSSVLVDEFQDLTPPDFVMCKALVEKSKSLTLVGDDDQHIYSFRSASSWFCHERVQAWFSENLNVLQLPENRRCPGAIVRSAVALIENNSRRAEKGIVAVRPNGTPVRVIGCQTLKFEMELVIQRIKRLQPKVRAAKEQILVLFRTNDLLNKFHKCFRLMEVPTSRVLAPVGRAGSIGLKTTAVFALVALMSTKVDQATVVWAVITIVPALDRLVVQSILYSVDSATGNEESLGTEELFPSNEAGANTGKKAVHMTVPQNLVKPFPSPHLEKLRLWYEEHRNDDMNIRERCNFEHLHLLFERTERLILSLRNANDVGQVVKLAEEIVCGDDGGEYVDFAEFSASQEEEEPRSEMIDDDKAGYDLLTSAVRKIDGDDDDDNNEDDNDNGHYCTKADTLQHQRTTHSDEGDDIEDFASLFKQDTKLRTQKKKKFFPGSDVHSTNITRRRKKLGKKINKLCSAMEPILTKSDHTGRGKTACTERPVVVLSTIHRAKGTSFAYVFLCGADDNNLPVCGRDLAQTCGADLDTAFVEEERRLLFVSLTRTQREFMCTYSVPTPSDQSKWLVTPSSIPPPQSPHPRAFQSPFLQELFHNLSGDQKCVTESFILETKDIKRVLDSFEAGPHRPNDSGQLESKSASPNS